VRTIQLQAAPGFGRRRSAICLHYTVSRKFVYQQTDKARIALDDAFSSAVPDDEVLFQLTVTKTWLRQVIVALTLICRSSYRGVVEFLACWACPSVSVPFIACSSWPRSRRVSSTAAKTCPAFVRACTMRSSRAQCRCWPASMPHRLTTAISCSLVEHRGANTWGVHLLDASRQGLKPDYTIADDGQGLRAGHKAAWGDPPCHGDIFHIQRLGEGLANTLSRLSKGGTSRRKKLEATADRAVRRGPGDDLISRLERAGQTETQASWLARTSEHSPSG
jgi:hypothetical protein